MGYIFNNVISGFVWEGMVHRTPNFGHVNGNSSYEKVGARKKKTECKPNASPTFFWIQIALILMLLYLFIYIDLYYIYIYLFIYLYGLSMFILFPSGRRQWCLVCWIPRFRSLLMIVQDLPEGLRPRDMVNQKNPSHKLSQVNHNPSVIPHFALSLVTVPNLITLSIYIYGYRYREREREREICIYIRIYIYDYMCV